MARRPKPGPTLRALKKAPGVADFEKAVSSVAGSHFSDIPITGDTTISIARVPRPTDPVRTREGPVPGEPNDSYLGRYNAVANKLVPEALLPPKGEHHFEFRPTIGSGGKHRLVPIIPGKGSRRFRTFGGSPPRVVIRRVGDGHEMVLQDHVRGEYRPTFVWPISEGRIGEGNWAPRSK